MTDGTMGDGSVTALADELRRSVSRQFGRSLHIRTLDTGSCAACEQEIRLLAAPHYDLHRLGFFFTPAPRHADLLMVTGPMIRAFDVAARKTYEAMPGPKLVVATGACALGGVYQPDAFTHGGVGEHAAGGRVDPGLPAEPAGPAAGPAGGGGPAGREGANPHLYPERSCPGDTVTAHDGAAAAWARWPRLAALGRRGDPAGDAGCAARCPALGGAAALAGGVSSLLSGNSRVVIAGGSVVVGTLQLQATSLAGVFAALLGLVAVAIAAFVPRYHEPGRGTALYLAVYNLALLASLAVLAAGNVVTFLVAWETMALLCYLLILRHPRRDEVAAGAFWFLALSETGFVLIVAAFVILAAKTHTMQLDADRGPRAPGARRLAGRRVPARADRLRVQGRAGAAARLAARGASGRARRRLGVPVRPGGQARRLRDRAVRVPAAARGPAWRGILTMAAGAVTAAIGILYALNERDIKRFLAFSTIENIGIIVTAFGAAMTFWAYGQRRCGRSCCWPGSTTSPTTARTRRCCSWRPG